LPQKHLEEALVPCVVWIFMSQPASSRRRVRCALRGSGIFAMSRATSTASIGKLSMLARFMSKTFNGSQPANWRTAPAPNLLTLCR
jgi:hypothetical protein